MPLARPYTPSEPSARYSSSPRLSAAERATGSLTAQVSVRNCFSLVRRAGLLLYLACTISPALHSPFRSYRSCLLPKDSAQYVLEPRVIQDAPELTRHSFFSGLATLPHTSSAIRAGPVDARDALFAPLREVATSHAVLAVALVGVIILQSAQCYSERLEERERIEEDEARIRRRLRRKEQEEKKLKKTTSTAQEGVSSSVQSN